LDEEEFAEILLVSSGFDKFMIGDFLAKEKEPNINGKILWLFMQKIDFQQTDFLDAIRFLLSRINLPQDSTLILGILDVFTQVYYKDNEKIFKDSNTLYLLASTIFAINTLFHKNMVNMPTLKKEDFIRMNNDVDPIVLGQIYEEVKINKLDFTYECKKITNFFFLIF
jgi:Sec7-like guanine-nucleotide exchange factor